MRIPVLTMDKVRLKRKMTYKAMKMWNMTMNTSFISYKGKKKNSRKRYWRFRKLHIMINLLQVLKKTKMWMTLIFLKEKTIRVKLHWILDHYIWKRKVLHIRRLWDLDYNKERNNILVKLKLLERTQIVKLIALITNEAINSIN